MENSEELEALKNRVCRGNAILNAAWEQIKAMAHDSQQWREQFERWSKANERLSLLATELKLKYNYNQCLYIDGSGKKTKRCLPPGDDIGCRVCPSARAWWTEELMNLPSPKGKLSERGQETMEFVKKLGEEI